MRVLFGYILQYIRTINWSAFASIVFILSLLILCNYYFGLNRKISEIDSNFNRAGIYSLLLFLIFGGSYLVTVYFKLIAIPRDHYFYIIFFSSIILFAMKMGIRFDMNPAKGMLGFPDGRYW